MTYNPKLIADFEIFGFGDLLRMLQQRKISISQNLKISNIIRLF